jgi:PhnB protein
MSQQFIIPMLAYEDGVAALEWLCRVFGFTERVRWLDDAGKLSHGEIEMDGQVVMLATPTPDYQSPAHHRKECAAAHKWSQTPYIVNGILVLVKDVKRHFARAVENNATILSALEEGGPGTRYRVEDLEGQRWMFMERTCV